MSSFIGGSAYGMANQVAEGYTLVSTATLKKFQPHELRELQHELEKLAREMRGEVVALDDIVAVQKRNRKLGRIQQTQLLLKTQQERKR